MLEAYGNIWDLASDYDAIVITTNGYVKKNGEAVMGRGIALEAAEKNPGLPLLLGEAIKEEGNRVFMFPLWRVWNSKVPHVRTWNPVTEITFITFPVKPVVGTKGEMGWKAKADIDLIRTSTEQLVELMDAVKGYDTVIMPRPGCGNGGLKWEQVKPVIEPLLDDRFTVVTFHP